MYVSIQDYIQYIPIDIVMDNFVITAMTPVLDTPLVGTASGHILVYQDDKLVSLSLQKVFSRGLVKLVHAEWMHCCKRRREL